MQAVGAGMVRAAIAAASPMLTIGRCLRWLDASTLACDGWTTAVRAKQRILLIGAGKAAAPMTLAALRLLRERPGDDGPELNIRGAVVTKYDHASAAQIAELRSASLAYFEAGHPVPDERGLEAAASILSLVSATDEDDLVLVLLSGGGSSLLPLPFPGSGIGLADIQAMNRALLAAGCTIHEVNAIRKHVSGISGGRLAAAAAAGARILTLALSDVVGDDPDAIASGPTVPDSTSFADCAAIVRRYPGLALPAAVAAHLDAGAAGRLPDTPKEAGAPQLRHFAIVGSNRLALLAARDHLQATFGGTPSSLVLTSQLQGEAEEVGKVLTALALDAGIWSFAGRPLLTASTDASSSSILAAVIAGGETTVTMRRGGGASCGGGCGKGGRNQHLALSVLIALRAAGLGRDGRGGGDLRVRDVAVLALGTDGSDGPTDAAGVFVPSARAHIRAAATAGLDLQAALSRYDAYTHFAAMDAALGGAAATCRAEAGVEMRPGGLIITGATGTNVCDVLALLVLM